MVEMMRQAGSLASASNGAALSAVPYGPYGLTLEAVQAGADRLTDVLGCAGPTYVAEQVFLAMQKSLWLGSLLCPKLVRHPETYACPKVKPKLLRIVRVVSYCAYGRYIELILFRYASPRR